MNEPVTQSAVGSTRLVGPPDCYVGRKPCGCLVAWVFDSKEHAKDVAKSVAQFIRDGYSVERANTNAIRSELGPCKCKKPKVFIVSNSDTGNKPGFRCLFGEINPVSPYKARK